jgi:NAD(P)-dependent dehydrogenase (short-subunit alcohol dehydrogenase family)
MVDADRIDGSVALVTGGAGGIGAAVAERLAGLGARVVVADLDGAAAAAVADRIGGRAVRCDVGRFDDNLAAVATAVDAYGGLDVVALNAGVSTGYGPDLDLASYRRAIAVNLDGVVFGAHAARPALRARGGGDIVATASLAGLDPTPLDPIYSANKAAVVGLVRALGPAWAGDGIRVNALCPGFTDTPMVDPLRHALTKAGMPLMPADSVVDAFLAALTGGRTGECWFVQFGRAPEPFRFPRVPGIRAVPTGVEG